VANSPIWNSGVHLSIYRPSPTRVQYTILTGEFESLNETLELFPKSLGSFPIDCGSSNGSTLW
jgi:hypothetical protein